MSIRRTNNEILQKISTGDFTEGGLVDENFQNFFRDVQQQTDVLDTVRAISVTAPDGDIPRMGTVPRSMQAVAEGESAAEVTIDQPSVSYQCTKTSIPISLTWESITETIDNPAEAIREQYLNQFSADLEALASVGDESSTDTFESINDGWITIAENRGSPTYDHADDSGAAQPVSKELFEGMLGELAERYKEQQNLVFLMSRDNLQEYKEQLTDRNTAAGDALLLTQRQPSAYGYNILTPVSWPDDTVLCSAPENLCYVVQDNIRLKQTQKSKENVMNDIAVFMNFIAKFDYQLLESDGVVLGNNVAAP